MFNILGPPFSIRQSPERLFIFQNPRKIINELFKKHEIGNGWVFILWIEENASMSILTFDQPLNSPPLPSGVSEEEKVIAVSEEY